MKKNRLFILMFLSMMLIVSLTTACSQSALKNDDFPNKPIKIVVAYSPGGSSDRAARLMQPFLEKELETSVIVENIPGAGGQVAATNLLRLEPDGYTILAVNSPGIYYTIAIDGAKYNFDDLTPLWVESNDPIILLTMKDSPWIDLKDFIEDVKQNPGKYAVGFASGGGQQAVAMWLKNVLNLDFKIVSYDGGGPASAALLGGHVDAIFGDAYARIDIREEAKCLGIAHSTPNDYWPEGKPFNEQLDEYGVEKLQDNFQARFGAYWVNSEFKNRYPERFDRLVEAFKSVAQNEEYIKMLEDAGLRDSMVLEDGREYIEYFNESYKFVEDIIAPLIKKQ